MAKTRTLLSIFLGLIIVLFGLSFYVRYKIGQEIKAGFSDLKGADYGSHQVDLWQGKIAISEISLNTKTVQINSALNGKKIVGTINEAYIDGLHWWNLLRNKRLIASDIVLKNPLLKVIKIPLDSISSAKVSEVKNTQAFFAEIKNLEIKNGEIAFFGGEKIENPSMKFGSFSLHFKNLTFDDALTQNKLEIVDYDLNLENFYFQANDKLHDLNLEKVTTEGKNINLHNLTFKSPLETDAFFQKIQHKKSKFDISIPEIILQNFHLEKIFQKEFSLPLLTINSPQITIFSDKNIPALADEQKALPTKHLRNLKSSLSIDSIAINNAKVTYSLKAKEKKNRGEIFWTNVNATMENITNDSLKIAQNQDWVTDINSKFMGSSNFDLTIRFFLDSPVFAYDVYGKLDTFDMRQTNQMFEDVTRIQVESGNVKELVFDFHADDNKSKGLLDFYYKDLQVRLIQEKNKRPRKLLKWILEKVIIKKNNTVEDSNKKGEIDIIRDKKKGIFNQLWNSVLDGLKDVILPS